MKIIKHKFVEYMPESHLIEDGILYISMEYSTAIHKCPCGCNKEVVTPLSPTDWKLSYNGETISLYPSIGNWDFECQSHYWVENNNIKSSDNWSQQKINAGRTQDKINKIEYYNSGRKNVKPDSKEAPFLKDQGTDLNWWAKLKNWLF